MDTPAQIFVIEYPAVVSAGLYYFTTDAELRYEVRFGRRKDNILHATIVFGVINDDLNDEEYAITNRGEVFRVMNTIVQIVRHFINEHPMVNVYEFHAVNDEPTDGRNREQARLHLYERYLPKIFGTEWKFVKEGSSMMVYKL